MNNTTVQADLYGVLKKEFATIERTSPELLCKYMHQQPYDLLILGKNVNYTPDMCEKIEKVQKDHPKTIIISEVEMDNTQALVMVNDLAIDRVIFHPINKSKVIKLLERTFHSHYEMVQNEKYEHHLEDIIFGQTQHIQTQDTLDKLTGLKNITSMKKLFNKTSEKGLLFLDVDDFDTINTLYGMTVGDKALLSIAKRIKKFLSPQCELFRLSADEFAIVTIDMHVTEVFDLGQQIIAMFNETVVTVDDIDFDIGFSIGLDVGSSYEIFHNAKIANREAKSMGGRKCVKYNKSSSFLMQQKDNHFWTQEIKDALRDDRFIVYYQPIYDTKKLKVTKYEALARMENVKGDIITPNFFIAPAMTANLLSRITRVIIDKSFKTFKDNDFNFSINVSEQDFQEKYLVDYLKYKCEFYDVSPQRIYLEILEEMSFNNSELFDSQVKQLQSMGFKFSIDDFGVEKSNFSRFMGMSVDMIKIDGSFIRNMEHDENSGFIIESIVALAQKLGAKTVAEYVENETTFNRLGSLGVDFAQGYHIGRPQSDLCS